MAGKKKDTSRKTGVTGGGEFSEGGGPGRTSETQGNRDAMSGSGGSGSGSESSGKGWESKSGGSGFETSRQTSTSSGNEGLSAETSSSAGSGKSGRYSIDCSEAGEGCSLRISGTYDEVLSAGVEHGRSAHGMSGDDKKLRDDIKGYIKEEGGVSPSGMPGSYQGRGQSQSGASPRPS